MFTTLSGPTGSTGPTGSLGASYTGPTGPISLNSSSNITVGTIACSSVNSSGIVTSSSGISGTLLTASQSNITSLGTLAALNISSSAVTVQTLVTNSTVTFTNLTDYSGTSGVTNQVRYISFGGVKLAWGNVSFKYTSATVPGTITITPTGGFFSSVNTAVASVSNMIHLVPQYISVAGCSASSLIFYTNVGGNGTSTNDGSSTAGIMNFVVVGS